jgi:hypothetical protein
MSDPAITFSKVNVGGFWQLTQCDRCGSLVAPPARGAGRPSTAQRLHLDYHLQQDGLAQELTRLHTAVADHPPTSGHS